MKKIIPGTRLMLTPENMLETEEYEFVSILESADAKGNIVFQAPIVKDRIYLLAPGDVLFAWYVDEMARYDFECVVTGRSQTKNVSLIEARIEGDIVETQRRDDFRVKVTSPQRAAIKIADENGDLHLIDCLLADLSSSGISLCTKDEYEENEGVIVSIQIGRDRRMLALEAQVRWCADSGRKDYKYRIGAVFTNPDLDEKKKIKDYVFHLQRQFLQHRRDAREK